MTIWDNLVRTDKPKGLLIIIISVVVIYAFGVIYMAVNNWSILILPDTDGYMYQASLKMSYSNLFLQNKPLLIPLFFKFMNMNTSVIAVMQVLIFFISWTFLTIAIIMTTRSLLVSALALIILPAYSFIDNIFIWNLAIMSESISISLIVALIGAWVLMLKRPSKLSFSLVLVFGALLIACRDTSAYAIYCLVPLMVLYLVLFRRSIPLKFKITYSILISLYLFMATLSIYTANKAERWVRPFLNILSQHILENPEYLAFFEGRGMPVNDALLSRAGKWSHSDDDFYFNNPDLNALTEWTAKNGKRTYLNFLLSHPSYFIGEPFSDFDHMLLMDLSTQLSYVSPEYRSSLSGRYWSAFHSNMLSDKKTSMLLAMIIAVFILLAIIGLSKNNKLAIIALTIGLIGFPHYIIAFRGDTMEILRHCLVPIVQFHLSLILGFLAISDTLLVHLNKLLPKTLLKHKTR